MSNESLSALLDGEISAVELDRVLNEMRQSPALAQRWSRLWLRREAQQGTRILKQQACICGSVMMQLAQIAPDPVAETPKVVELASRRRLPPQVWKPLAGFAAAASVAAVAVLVIQPGSSSLEDAGSDRSSSPTINVNNPIPMPTLNPPGRGGYQTVSVSPQELQLRAWVQNDEPTATELRELALSYNNSSAQQSLGGTLRYASFGVDTGGEYRYENADGQR